MKTTDELIEQMTAMQDPRNQHAFRETLRSIVRLARVEERLEARGIAIAHQAEMTAETLH